MSFWVTAYCHKSVASITPKDLLIGIGERLAVLAGLLPGDFPEEETPEAIRDTLLRLKIDTGKEPFRPNALTFLPNGPSIALQYLAGAAVVQGIIKDEVLPGTLNRRRSEAAKQVRSLLTGATEKVSFALKVSHLDGLGFHIAIAAAATLVEYAGGVIRSGSSSWMVPVGYEVDILLEYDE